MFLNNQLLLHNFERSIAQHFSNKMLDYFKIGLLNKPLHISAVVRLASPIWTEQAGQVKKNHQGHPDSEMLFGGIT